MDQPKRPAGKSYSEVMNEWAAQREFMGGNRSRLLHPPFDAHPVRKALGYLGRLLVVIVIPLVIYLVVLGRHVKSKEFNQMISDGIATVLSADTVTAHGAFWEFDGILALKSMKATEILERCTEVNRIETAADAVHRRALSQLFVAGNDALLVMKWRDIYDGLEAATDVIEAVANVIEGVVLEYA